MTARIKVRQRRIAVSRSQRQYGLAHPSRGQLIVAACHCRIVVQRGIGIWVGNMLPASRQAIKGEDNKKQEKEMRMYSGTWSHAISYYRLPNGNLSHHAAHFDDVASLRQVKAIALVIAVNSQAQDSHASNIIDVEVLTRSSRHTQC